MANRRIKWDACALKQFDKAIDYIEADSPKNAKKVAWDITEAIEKAIKNPQHYPPDKYKKNSNGSIRVFELHHFRISYFIGKDVIRIVRFRHTSKKPKEY